MPEGDAHIRTIESSNTLSTLLNRWHPLTAEDEQALGEIHAKSVSFTHGSSFIHQEDLVRDLPVLAEGWAAQYRLLQDGRRFVLKLNLPGEVVDGCFPLRQPAQYSAEALTDVTLLLFPAKPLLQLMHENAHIAIAVFAIETYQHSLTRNRVMALAGLNAYERLGHLCLELLTRLEVLGLAKDDAFDLPVIQATLGDLLGMHGVHVNRMFKQLEADGFIERNKKTVRIRDREGLASLVDFREADIIAPPTIPDFSVESSFSQEKDQAQHGNR